MASNIWELGKFKRTYYLILFGFYKEFFIINFSIIMFYKLGNIGLYAISKALTPRTFNFLL